MVQNVLEINLDWFESIKVNALYKEYLIVQQDGYTFIILMIMKDTMYFYYLILFIFSFTGRVYIS